MNSAARDSERVTVDGHQLSLTRLNKVLYPASQTTKRDVLAYYSQVAPLLLAHTRDRPATRKRWVNGVGSAAIPEPGFFQKNLDDSTPPWVNRRTIQHRQHSQHRQHGTDYPLVNDLATLMWLGQLAALEIHVPQWRFGPNGEQQNPDRLVFDLDPGEGAGLQECAYVAQCVKPIVSEMGLEIVPVTSGSKGIHLYCALDGAQTSTQVSAVAHELARMLEADHPQLIVSTMDKAARRGKVFMDWSQNNGSKTTVTPYSLRGRELPTVAAPRTWSELRSPTLTQLDYRDVLARTPAPGDRLERYRNMRDSNKTPEPVPVAAPLTSTGSSFVIQEHHARRLHWDLRLERDGVLLSWAVPKGIPTTSNYNHLAVQTEDHPLEYANFEGTIPPGEYGAGVVTIWDSGTYETHKWREGKEIIVVLHGSRGAVKGAPMLALIHTGTTDAGADRWLIHLMTPG